MIVAAPDGHDLGATDTGHPNTPAIHHAPALLKGEEGRERSVGLVCLRPLDDLDGSIPELYLEGGHGVTVRPRRCGKEEPLPVDQLGRTVGLRSDRAPPHQPGLRPSLPWSVIRRYLATLGHAFREFDAPGYPAHRLTIPP